MPIKKPDPRKIRFLFSYNGLIVNAKSLGLFRLLTVFQNNVMIAALYDTGGRYQGNLSFFLQLRNGQAAAVAHGMFHLAQGQIDIVFQTSGVGYIRVNTLFEGKLLGAAQVVALPVAGTG